jgi:uncharacterized protein (TIGR00299 family) protein
MKYVYFDASAGLSGDMILGALLDLGVSPEDFKREMAKLKLPVTIKIQETKRSSLRALEVTVSVNKKQEIKRKWADIKLVIENSPFSLSVRKQAAAVFKRLFEAESHVHGRKFDETHLHEAGADDAIIDILGCCYLAEVLNIRKFFSSPLNVGRGWVKGSHGILPVPPPAVGELLKNVPVYSVWAEEELVTPTGAAIITTLAQKFMPFPEISYEKIGCGAGRRNFPELPNILRAFYGKLEEIKPEKRVYTIEANIDDSNPQVLASFIDLALKWGALDVFLTPVFMKKNRLGSKLTVLAEIDKIDFLIDKIFRETSSIGVRYFPVERRTLERKIIKIELLEEEIRIKAAYLDGHEVNIQPEFSDCQRLAKKKQLPLKKIFELALTAYSNRALESGKDHEEKNES